jgi:hypothetical protein
MIQYASKYVPGIYSGSSISARPRPAETRAATDPSRHYIR